MEKFVLSINHILDKVTEFRHLVLLSTFVLFLDYYLIAAFGESLIELKYTDLEKIFSIGEVFQYLIIFLFYSSFVVPLIRYILSFTLSFLPYRLVDYFSNSNASLRRGGSEYDYYRTHQVKDYAVKNNNKVAYQYYKSLVDEETEDYKLEQYCLAFLVVSIANYFAASSSNEVTIISIAINMFTIESPSIGEQLKQLLILGFYFLCTYVAIVRGCNITSSLYKENYMKDNPFNNRSDYKY